MEYGVVQLCMILGQEHRFRMLQRLDNSPQDSASQEPRRKGLPLYVLAEECGITSATASAHLGVLIGAGLAVKARNPLRKQEVLYRLADSPLPSLVTYALAYDAGREA